MQRWRPFVERLLEHHGFTAALDPHPPRSGNVCEAYFTAEVVLKIPSPPRWNPTISVEVIGSAVGRAAGVRTPELLAHVEDGGIIDAPYAIWARVRPAVAPPETAAFWKQVGGEIAQLHMNAEPAGRATRDHGGPERHLSAAETVFADRPYWPRIRALAERLDPLTRVPGEPRFLHADVHARNVLAAPDGSLAALVDWGDSGVGDAAYDLARAPIPVLPHMLESYERALGAAARDDTPGRILAHRLSRMLRLPGPGRAEARDFLTFVDNAPMRWRRFVS